MRYAASMALRTPKDVLSGRCTAPVKRLLYTTLTTFLAVPSPILGIAGGTVGIAPHGERTGCANPVDASTSRNVLTSPVSEVPLDRTAKAADVRHAELRWTPAQTSRCCATMPSCAVSRCYAASVQAWSAPLSPACT